MAYDNPAAIIAASIIMEVVAATCVTLRFYTRWWRKTKVLVADWLILAAFLCGTGLTVMELYGMPVLKQEQKIFNLHRCFDQNSCSSAQCYYPSS